MTRPPELPAPMATGWRVAADASKHHGWHQGLTPC